MAYHPIINHREIERLSQRSVAPQMGHISGISFQIAAAIPGFFNDEIKYDAVANHGETPEESFFRAPQTVRDICDDI